MSLGLLLLPVCVAQPADLPPVVPTLGRTMTFYYQKPDPEVGPKLLAELLKKENIEHPWFEKRGDVLRLIAAQLGDIGRGKPEVLRKYEAAFAGAPKAGRLVIARALEVGGDADSGKAIVGWVKAGESAEVRAALEKALDAIDDPKRKHYRDGPVSAPHDLDLLWANFFVTGEYAPAARILDVLDQPDTKENAVLKRVARWSFESNLKQHPRLVELSQKHLNERPEASKKELEKMLAAAAGAGKP